MSFMNGTADTDPPAGSGVPSGLPGPVAFQLVLLRRMADHHPGLVEDALRTLRASRADMREANRRWQARMHAPRARGGAWPYRALLGTPETVTARRIGDLTCEALAWTVPLWPDLRFEVLTGTRGPCGTPGSSGHPAPGPLTCARPRI